MRIGSRHGDEDGMLNRGGQPPTSQLGCGQAGEDCRWRQDQPPRHQLSSGRRRVDSRHVQATGHPPPTARPGRSTKRYRFSIDSRGHTGTLPTAAGNGAWSDGSVDGPTSTGRLVDRKVLAYGCTDPSRSALGQHLPCHPLLRRQNRARAVTCGANASGGPIDGGALRGGLTVDITERESRRSLADSLRRALANQGVVAVATTFVDNSGITRVKSVPLDRLPQLAAWWG